MHVNNDFQRISNISQTFETIWRQKEISRIDIARKLNVYRSTVSNIIDTLLEHKVILEGQRGEASEKGGRKPIYLSINKDFGAIAGIELQPLFYNVTVINFSGEEIFSYQNEYKIEDFQNSCDNEQKIFTSLLDFIINNLLEEVKSKSIKLLGICLALPGIIDTKNAIIKKSVAFGLKDMDFTSVIKRYSVPILIENDAKCCGWLHKAQREDVKDFICVLAREHKTQGISVGLCVVMNNKLINGHNYAAGEYISLSWKNNKKGQTGLPQAVIKTLTTVEDSYKVWVKDLFSTLTVMIPLLEPCKIYFHGQKAEKKQQILKIIEQEVCQFNNAMKCFGSELELPNEDGFEIAKGAALMFIQKLFEIHFLKDDYFYERLNWDTIFEMENKEL